MNDCKNGLFKMNQNSWDNAITDDNNDDISGWFHAEGKSVQKMVNEALQRVPNANGMLDFPPKSSCAYHKPYQYLMKFVHIFYFIFHSAGDRHIDQVFFGWSILHILLAPFIDSLFPSFPSFFVLLHPLPLPYFSFLLLFCNTSL